MQPSGKAWIALVVDTSVARAAGERTEHARACRDVLNTLEEQGFALAFSPALAREWLGHNNEEGRPHASRFARQWLEVMRSRRRVVDVSLPAETPLCSALLSMSSSESPLASLARSLIKDLHVIETALHVEQHLGGAYQGKRVLSLDKRVPEDVQALRPYVQDLSAVCAVQWVEPRDDHQAEDWLRQGAPMRVEYQLCNSDS